MDLLNINLSREFTVTTEVQHKSQPTPFVPISLSPSYWHIDYIIECLVYIYIYSNLTLADLIAFSWLFCQPGHIFNQWKVSCDLNVTVRTRLTNIVSMAILISIYGDIVYHVLLCCLSDVSLCSPGFLTSLSAHPALSVALRRLAVAGHVTRHIDIGRRESLEHIYNPRESAPPLETCR